METDVKRGSATNRSRLSMRSCHPSLSSRTSPKLCPRVGSSGAPSRKGDPGRPEPFYNPSTPVHGFTRDEGEGAVNVPLYSPSVLLSHLSCLSPPVSSARLQALPSSSSRLHRKTLGTEEAWELSPSPEIFECSANYHNLINWLL